MNSITRAGQLLYGMAIAAFGIEFFAFHSSLLGLMPLPPAINQAPWIYIFGLLFTAGGICIISKIAQPAASLSVALLLFILCLWLHLPAVIIDPSNGGKWTAVFELIALGSGALLMAGTVPTNTTSSTNSRMYKTGRILFAISLAVFGIQHFVYAGYIGTLVPDWIPARLFWPYLVGVAFIAVAVSLFFSLLARLSTSLLAVMFFLWVLLLHGPRVAASPNAEPEWSSLFVALAMGAVALQLVGLSTTLLLAARARVTDKEGISPA